MIPHEHVYRWEDGEDEPVCARCGQPKPLPVHAAFCDAEYRTDGCVCFDAADHEVANREGEPAFNGAFDRW